MLDEVASAMGRNIRDTKVDEGAALGQFHDFAIRH